MISLITTKTTPPGGWRYNQLDPQGKLVKSFASMNPFSMACSAILDFRQGNKFPRATMAEVQQDVIAATCQRLGNDPRYCTDSQKKTSGILNALSTAAGSAVARLRDKAGGLAVVGDYVLHGSVPVSLEQAQDRADVCTGRLTGKPCPHHTPAWDFNLAAQAVIKIEMDKRAKAGRKLEGEDSLKVCSICGCWLPLKVDVPFVTIWKYTSDAMFGKFPTTTPCWITQERKESKLQP